MYSCNVRYKYRKIGTGGTAWTSSSSLISQLKSQSETLVNQKLRERHKDCEIELISIDWK